MSKLGVCPVCNGTGHMPCTNESTRNYGKQYGWYGYREEDDTVTCNNCGGQYQWGTPTGQVKLNKQGTPCIHDYEGSAGPYRCTTNYDCVHCGDHYMIDSGD